MTSGSYSQYPWLPPCISHMSSLPPHPLGPWAPPLSPSPRDQSCQARSAIKPYPYLPLGLGCVPVLSLRNVRGCIVSTLQGTRVLWMSLAGAVWTYISSPYLYSYWLQADRMWGWSRLNSESASGIGLRRWQRGWFDCHASCGWRLNRPSEGHATEAWTSSHRGPGADKRTELSRRLSGRAAVCLVSSQTRGFGWSIQGCLDRLRCPRSGRSWARICWST